MKHKYIIYTLLVLMGIAAYIWSQVIYADSSSDKLKVDFLDVGQGDAILATLPDGDQLLVDGGPDRSVLSLLGRVMPAFDRKIEYVILTHPHADHVTGLVEVAEKYEVGTAISSGAQSDSNIYKNWQDLLETKKIPEKILRQGDQLDLGGTKLEVLWPASSVTGESNPNNASLVARLVYGKSEFMLTGDAEVAVQNQLCQLDEARLVADVLKAAHHGSSTGAVECFLEKVDASMVVISVGRDNKFGHPHAAALKLYQKWISQILRTDELGTISCVGDGVGVKCN